MESQLTQAAQPWQCVTGPMSAAYMHFQEMGWKVDIRLEENRILYTDKRNDTFQIMDGVSWHKFRESLEQDRIADLWPILCKHRAGQGLAHGADFTAGKKHYKLLVKKGRMREAGALMSILSGALWPPKRLVEQGTIGESDEGAYCPICGEHMADEGHIFWECHGIQSG